MQYVQSFLAIGAGCLFIWLAVARKIETALFLPLGFGTILMNLPGSDAPDGILALLFFEGVQKVEVLPLILFLGIGAMTDFSALIRRPWYLLLGLCCQCGVFAAMYLAYRLGLPVNDAVSAGIIGAADGPTAILVATRLHSSFLPAVTVASYSYIALVPFIQPLVIRLLVTKKEGCLKAPVTPQHSGVSRLKPQTAKILFPVIGIIVSGLLAPKNASLIGFLLLGNLIRECGLLDKVSDTLATVLVNIVTVVLALAISYNMRAANFCSLQTLEILALGFFAFCTDIAAGILLVKLWNLLFPRRKLNPIIASAGISAFPIATRIAQKEAFRYDSGNIILNDALALNSASQLASAVIGGLVLAVVG